MTTLFSYNNPILNIQYKFPSDMNPYFYLAMPCPILLHQQTKYIAFTWL